MVRDRLALNLAAGVIMAAILAPFVRPGYVLRYDMNFVPAQPLRPDLIAPVDSAPRAVPLDAAVSLLNTVIPGWMLQRLVLAAIIWAAVVGAGRLVPTESIAVRLVAGVGYGWTPFLAERLLIGQWGLLIAYAALPWLVKAALTRNFPALFLTAALCALTPSGGVIAAIVCLALLPWRDWWLAVAGLAVANSPWLVAALAGEAGSRSDPAGVAAFAARAENWGGAIVALLGTGGIWNEQTTPASRSFALVPFLTLGFVILGIIGYQIMRQRMPNRLPIAAGAGLLLAMLSTVHNGTAEWLAGHVPGAGLLRDAQKFVLPYALLLTLCVALGVERLARRLGGEPGRVLLAGMLAVIVGVMPDLAFGGAGAMKPVSYPSDWERVATLVAAQPGPVLSLPLSEYRRYAWNDRVVVLDPAPRYLPSPVLTDDTLIVGEHVIRGEDRRLTELKARLSAGLPAADGRFRWVLVQSPVPASALDGLQLIHQGPDLSLYRDPAFTESGVDTRRHLPILLAEAVLLLAMIVAAVTIAAAARR